MAKHLKFKRLSVDTNIIMALGLLYFRGEREFINTNLAGGSTPTAQKQYAEDIETIQKFIDSRRIEVVLTPQVIYELTFREKEVDDKGNPIKLKPDVIANQKIKDLALEYLSLMPKVKIARMLPNREEFFRPYCERLAYEYVHSYHIFGINKKGNLPSDAIIMAQTTALGMDFVTRDNHFKAKHYSSDYSKAEKIAITNHNFGSRKTKVFSVNEVSEILTNSTHGPKRYFEENTPLFDCIYLNYDEYLADKALQKQNYRAWQAKYMPEPTK